MPQGRSGLLRCLMSTPAGHIGYRIQGHVEVSIEVLVATFGCILWYGKVNVSVASIYASGVSHLLTALRNE